MAVAVDASSPLPKQASTTATFGHSPVSNTFSPPAGSLVLAFMINTSGSTAATSVTSSAGSLAFSKVGSATVSTKSYADCWVADCPTAQTAITLTATKAAGPGPDDDRDVSIHVLVLTGAAAAAAQTGHTAAGNGVNLHTGVTLSAAASDSWIFASAADFEAGDTPTFTGAEAGQTTSFNGQSGASTSQLIVAATGDSMWVQGNSAPGNTNLKMNTTTPSLASTSNSLFAVEILAAGAATAVAPPFAPPRMPLGV